MKNILIKSNLIAYCVLSIAICGMGGSSNPNHSFLQRHMLIFSSAGTSYSFDIINDNLFFTIDLGGMISPFCIKGSDDCQPSYYLGIAAKFELGIPKSTIFNAKIIADDEVEPGHDARGDTKGNNLVTFYREYKSRMPYFIAARISLGNIHTVGSKMFKIFGMPSIFLSYYRPDTNFMQGTSWNLTSIPSNRGGDRKVITDRPIILNTWEVMYAFGASLELGLLVSTPISDNLEIGLKISATPALTVANEELTRILKLMHRDAHKEQEVITTKEDDYLMSSSVGLQISILGSF